MIMKPLIKIVVTVILVFPMVILASEEYDLTVTIPIRSQGSEIEHKKITFTTYYPRLESLVSAITWDPCTSKGQSPGCNLVNPLHATNMSVELHAYNATDMDHLDGCFIKIVLPSAQAAEKISNKAKLLQLAVDSLQLNTRNSAQYVDCALRVADEDQSTEIGELQLPNYLNPIIPMCRPYTPKGHQQAISSNDLGMDHYRARQWKQAEALFRQAAEQDCNYLTARTNLASVYALQNQSQKAQAVLWRSYKLDAKRTLKKLETDSDYRSLKQDINFYSAASPIGIAYRHYCYGTRDPFDIDPQLPDRMVKSGLKKRSGIPYSVASRYIIEADFNKNGIADQVYPLVISHLASVLVLFDGNKLAPENCTSTPFARRDFSSSYKNDPCKIKLIAGAEGAKRGLRLQRQHTSVNRMVCQ